MKSCAHPPVSSLSLLSVLLVACGVPPLTGNSGASGVADLTERARPPVLPHLGGPAPWGRGASMRPEAVIANAASTALNDAWHLPETRDAIAAVPVAMLGSNVFPYGDGQSNAAPSFGGWGSSERPPLVATLIRSTVETTIAVRLDRALPMTAAKIRIHWENSAELEVPVSLDSNGDRTARFSAPAHDGAPFAVVPDGWRAGFAVSFAHPVNQAAALPVAHLLDLERVSAAADIPPSSEVVDATLRAHLFASSYNDQPPGIVVPYSNADVHAMFPIGGRLVRTGVGGGRTWVRSERRDGYKTMYQCFDGRDVAAEGRAPDGGVPSATGWHEIGDKAETVVNDLETVPMFVGFAARRVLPANEIGPDGFAWNLDAVATLRFLMPGEALISPRGTFHWFAFAGAAPTCAEIIVSPESASLDGFLP